MNGVIALVIAIVIGFIYYWLPIRPMKFSWQVMSRNRIIQAPDSAQAALEVFYAGHKMENPNILVLRLGNIGGRTIDPTDFEGPISVTFDRSILRNTSKPSVPRPFPYDLAENGQVVQIRPKFIKRHEYIDLQFTTDGPLDTPKVDAFKGKDIAITNSEKLARTSTILMMLVS